MRLDSILRVALLTSTILFSSLFWAPELAEASASSMVTITLQPTPPKADFSPGSSGIVTINGGISCRINGTDRLKVYLHAQSETGSANVNPCSMMFNGSNGTEETDTFIVATRVPKDYAFKGRPHVTVSGYYVQGALQFEIPPVTQIIEVEPYYKIEVDVPPPEEIGAGDFVYFPIRITNKGNSEDTYRFTLLNCEELCDEAWTIATITDKTILAGQTKTITLAAQAPQFWTLYRNDITRLHIRITSVNSEETPSLVRCDVNLYVRQKGIHIPGFSPTFALLGIGLVALMIGRKRSSRGKPPHFLSGHPKGLYAKLSMNMR